MTTKNDNSDANACESLEDYLFGLLSHSAAGEFEDHCATCRACRTAVRAEQDMKSLLREALDTVPVQSPANQTVPQSVVAVPTGRGDSRSRETVLVVALATLSVAFLFSVAGTPGPSVESQQPTGIVSNTESAADGDSYVQTPRIKLPEGNMGVTVPSDDPNIVVMLVFSKAERTVPRAGSSDEENPGLIPKDREFH